jgi:hypothetical protein
MNALSASELADLAGVTEAEVGRLVDLGVLVARDGVGPFLATDVPKVRLATACEQAGLPLAGIAAAVRAGRLSFAFLEAMGFARMAPDELIREDELEVVPLLQLGHASGFLDQAWSTRLGRGYQQGLGLVAGVEKEVWQARFMAPLLASGGDRQGAMERAAQRAGDLDVTPLIDRALLGAYRRQQELAWIESLVEDIEAALEETGVLRRPGGCRRCVSWTWWATPGSPRNGATRPPPRWPRPWPCWSAGRRASTAGCR